MNEQILVVTDCEERCSQVREMFQGRPEGVSIIRAESVDEAKIIIRRSAVDVLLLETSTVFADPEGLWASPFSGDVRKNLGFVRAYIYRHYKEPLTAKNIAGLFSVTPHYICQMFRDLEGMSFRSFLELTRLERAAALLRGTDQTIGKIAHAVGFCNDSYFARRFRTVYGISPAKYRKQCRRA
ncbi:MAG: helix-turn-helix domain-containing protein [Lachnospiraceae bacterium]